MSALSDVELNGNPEQAFAVLRTGLQRANSVNAGLETFFLRLFCDTQSMTYTARRIECSRIRSIVKRAITEVSVFNVNAGGTQITIVAVSRYML